ncbi:type III-B CRISPR module-associated Cmr3 family protein [Nocardiopsis sp. N85]|uniref:type III-B CRISPR module-associated Cmr3 family protein n=1 Tax=Nocardiopsis sp. N85 TaxID=3029400 RepID=UPI00237F7F57|nr:type III-B CRISPR module-associated Cmr3 family protein [Nocardiopsis sp. N85]MDE3725304.1 type III-B CRISPR module-associated Cmr3 family protein [Nocardiopsis sp. N85]
MTTTDDPGTSGVWVTVDPHDTVQVRDGRSFDAGAGGVAHSVRPWPSTAAGALAAALGGEPESLRGPFVAHRDGTEWSPYFPAPLDLVTEPDAADVWRLCHPQVEDGGVDREGGEGDDVRIRTDLQASGHPDLVPLSLPEGVEEADPLSGLVPGGVLKSYLHGTLVDAGEVVSQDEWGRVEEPVTAESRIGVGLDPDARTVKGGLLYRTTHLRLEEDWAFAVHLTPRPGRHRPVEEVAEPVRFGGLTRLADLAPAQVTGWPDPPEDFPDGKVLLYVATPAVWPTGWVPPLPDDARLVSAVVGAPLPVATASPVRDYKHFQRTRAMAWAVPPGSIYLLQFLDPDDATTWAHSQHGLALGPAARPRWDTAGFGVVLTGVWS